VRLLHFQMGWFPGFEQGGPVLSELSSGLNLIVGPNGSGKTSLVRAIQALLWPERLKAYRHPTLRSEWASSKGRLTIDVFGTPTVSCLLDGREAKLPALPSALLADCFAVSVDDLLLESSPTDEELAREMAKQLSGGFDLAALKESPAAKFSIARAQRTYSELQDAERQIADLRSGEQDLMDRARELVGLKRKLIDYNEREKRLKQLEAAEAIAPLREKLAIVRSRIGLFPQVLAKLRGAEEESLLRLKQSIAKHTKELALAQEEARSAEILLSELRLPPERPAEEELRRLEAVCDSLREHERSLVDSEQSMVRLETELMAIGDRMGDPKIGARLESVKLPALEDVEELKHSFEDWERSVQVLEERLKFLSIDETIPDTGDLRLGIDYLRKWLRVPPQSLKRRAKFIKLLLFGCVALLAAVIAVLAWLLTLMLLGLELIPLGILITALLHSREADLPDVREIQREYPKLPLNQPAQWKEDEVSRLLQDLEKTLERAVQREYAKKEKRQLELQLDELRKKEHALAERKEKLLYSLGLPKDRIMGNLTLTNLFGLLTYAQKKHIERKGLVSLSAELRQKIQNALQELNAFFLRHGAAKALTSKEAATAIRIIQSSLIQERELKQRREAALKSMDKEQKWLSEEQRELEELYRGLGLKPEDELELRAAFAEFPNYRETQEELRHLERQVSTAEIEVSAYWPELLSLGPDKLGELKR